MGIEDEDEYSPYRKMKFILRQQTSIFFSLNEGLLYRTSSNLPVPGYTPAETTIIHS